MIDWGTPTLYGKLGLIEDRNCYRVDTIQFRFPRSKKVRIRRKWAKQAKNFRLSETPLAYRVGSRIYAHPIIVNQLRIVIQQQAGTALHSGSSRRLPSCCASGARWRRQSSARGRALSSRKEI